MWSGEKALYPVLFRKRDVITAAPSLSVSVYHVRVFGGLSEGNKMCPQWISGYCAAY